MWLQEEARAVAALKQAFRADGADPALAQALAGAVGLPDETPIFVVGLPRSGSSLVEQIIASHPQAFGAGVFVGSCPDFPHLIVFYLAAGAQGSTSSQLLRMQMAHVQEACIDSHSCQQGR